MGTDLVQFSLLQNPPTDVPSFLKENSIMINYNFISCGYRFGVAALSNRYIAFHGQPNRNDDFYTVTEISNTEYQEILTKAPTIIENRCASSETAQLFFNRFINGRPVLYEGWTLPDDEAGIQ